MVLVPSVGSGEMPPLTLAEMFVTSGDSPVSDLWRWFSDTTTFGRTLPVKVPATWPAAVTREANQSAAREAIAHCLHRWGLRGRRLTGRQSSPDNGVEDLPRRLGKDD
jgi:hypothetical protein